MVKKIGFRLSGIRTEQFAIIEEAYNELADVNFGYDFNFAHNVEQRVVAVIAKVRFEQERIPFLKIEVSNHFQISEESWAEIFSVSEQKITLPKEFVLHLFMLSIGNTRGILHARTENTPFNKYIVPTVNLTKLISDEVVTINL